MNKMKIRPGTLTAVAFGVVASLTALWDIFYYFLYFTVTRDEGFNEYGPYLTIDAIVMLIFTYSAWTPALFLRHGSGERSKVSLLYEPLPVAVICGSVVSFFMLIMEWMTLDMELDEPSYTWWGAAI